MNKNIIKTILVGSLVLTSCNRDLLTAYVPGALTQEIAIQTPADLAAVLNTAYANINSRAESEQVSVFTDEVGIGSQNGGQGIQNDNEYLFNVTPQTFFPRAMWTNNYVALAYINRVIDFAKTIPTTATADQIAVNKTLAQAYALRAFCHLKILAYFTTDMTSDTALAGILADHTFDASISDNNQRATNKQFYDLIQSDCDKSIALYNALPASALVDKTIANKFFAVGLKARAFSYKGDYPNAETYANQVIAQSGLILANTAASYQQVFFTDNEAGNVETIFRLKRTPIQNAQGFNLHNAWCSVTPNLAGSPFYDISRALYNKLAVNQTDYRYRTIVSPTSIINPNYATSPDYRSSDQLIINKHGGTAVGSVTAATSANGGLTNDIKIMRLSEMYFIKAEARAAASDPLGAALAVNAVKAARYTSGYTPDVYGSTQAAWAGILDQRRLEFAFEGYRFIDLKRIGVKAGEGIDRDAADYSSSSSNFPAANPANLPLSSYKFALPIPQVELVANNVITQNPGY